jgi:ATP-dependent RNA helicase DeaD
MKDPKVLDFSESDVAGDTIDQYYITVDPRRKFDALVHLLRQEEPKQAIIFTRTKRGADRLFRLLEEHHWKIGVIHGDLSQSVRDRAMDRFRKDRVQLLVATDVVGRGIDITGISHIINYDIPQFSDDYIHRVGRTGRMGREGTAYTFVSTEQGGELTRIEKRINRLLKRVELKGFEAYANPAAEEKQKEPPKPVFGRPVRRIRRAL